MRVAVWAAGAATLVAAHAANAETHAIVAAGGGLPSFEVTVDPVRGVVVVDGHEEIPITLEKARLPHEDAVIVEPLAIGLGKHVVHVRVPALGADEVAWEALLAGGRPQPLFAGITGPVSGDPGERTGKAIQIVGDGEKSYVLLGDVREDLRICGQSTTLLDPQALYPASLEFRPATVHRLGADQRAAAEQVEAKPVGAAMQPPLAPLLVARGSSVPASRGNELTDGDPKTVWQEMRPGIGQGEFVVMAAPKDAPIVRLQVVLAPPDASAGGNGAAPKTFYLVTDHRTIRVSVPEDAWRKPGEAFEVAFAKPVETSCLALVLDDAYARGLAHPDVGIAELAAYTELDAAGTSLDDLAAHLSGDRGAAAAQVLERAGPAALGAVAKAYDSLDARGRAFAVDVAASADRCEDAAPLLTRAMCETSGEAPRKAREKLERCAGAAHALAERMRDVGSRECVAPIFATLFPASAIDPIADALATSPEGDARVRQVLRQALGKALHEAPAERLAALFGDASRSAIARLEMMRAVDVRVTGAPGPCDAVLSELLSGAPSFRVRYLALGPLGALAHAGDLAATRAIERLGSGDPEWPVRARAVDAASGVAALQTFVVGAASDPEPRVRESALAVLVDAPPAQSGDVAMDRLAHDGWWFVRTEAVRVLSALPARREVDDALGAALEDGSARVRGSAVLALGHRRASGWRGAVRKLLEDKDEDDDVRAEAATALGAMCDEPSIDRLTQLARQLAVPGADAQAQTLGLGALVGLAALHPADLRERLAPLSATSTPPPIRAAAARALADHGACR